MSSVTASTDPVPERVVCHQCSNEWWRDEHGLECPQCHGDFVEIIDPNDDPRDDDLAIPPDPISPPESPRIRDHNPWRDPAPDPGEENIDHVAFSAGPGMHFQRTFMFRSGGSRGGNRVRGPATPNDNLVGSIFQAALGSFAQGGAGPNRQGHDLHGGPMFPHPQFGGPPPFHPNRPPNNIRTNFQTHGNGGGRIAWATGGQRFPPNPPPAPQGPVPELFMGLQAMLNNMAQDMNGPNQQAGANRNANRAPGTPFLNLHEFFTQLMNPHAVHGDGVYTQEAFDRLVGQFMEANQGHDGPEPASDAAIAALPKKKIDKSMLGDNGTAECSVCIESVKIGDEVTVLPCQHWFHEQCVGMWLKSHDTCPHCRKGITAAEGESEVPRSPGQTPRTDMNIPQQWAPPNANAHGPGAPFTQPGMQQPYMPGGYEQYPEPESFVQPPQPPPNFRPSSQQPELSRRSSRQSSANSRGHAESSRSPNNSSGGVTGWLRNLRGSNHRQD